jgi:hypothetical protein
LNGDRQHLKPKRNRTISHHRLHKLFFPLLGVCLFLACRSESLFHRLSDDYLPYDNLNSKWVYRVTGQDTLTVEWTITVREAVGGRQASRIESTEGVFHYALESDALLEFVTHTVLSFSEELVLEERWRTRLERPLNLGNRWEETFENSVIDQGLTYSIESSIEGIVEDIETVLTPVDFFEECYRVSFEIRSRITLPAGKVEEERTRMTEWYAPGVGMVKREIEDGNSWELTDYQVL